MCGSPLALEVYGSPLAHWTVHRDYIKFDNISFHSDTKNNLAGDNEACLVFEDFNSIAGELMNTNAPIKEKYLRANGAPFTTKALRKAIMLRTQ